MRQDKQKRNGQRPFLFCFLKLCEIAIKETLAKRIELVNGQPHYVEIVALKALDPKRGKALHGIGARLVVRLAAFHVPVDLLLAHFGEAHARAVKIRDLSLAAKQRHTADHAVRGIGERAQHTRGILAVSGLAEDLVRDRHHGVRGDDQRIVIPLAACAQHFSRGASLTERQLAHQLLGDGDIRVLVRIRAEDLKFQ